MKKGDLFPMNEVGLEFRKLVILSNQYKSLKIWKCNSMALMSTFDIP